MRWSRGLALTLIPAFFVACATAGAPLGGGGGSESEGADAGGASAYGSSDGGSIPEGGLVHKDGGTIVSPDGGVPPIVDSGPPPPTATFCTGQTSTHRNDYGTKNYDDWCDETASFYYEFDCNDNSDCTGNFTASYEPECCYQPEPGGYCEGDYGGTPQCVPQ